MPSWAPGPSVLVRFRLVFPPVLVAVVVLFCSRLLLLRTGDAVVDGVLGLRWEFKVSELRCEGGAKAAESLAIVVRPHVKRAGFVVSGGDCVM